MINKEIAVRFFDGFEGLEKEINLTEEEVELFLNLEYQVLCANGLKNINGGWSSISIYEGNDEELKLSVSCGCCDEEHSDKTTWERIYDRLERKLYPFPNVDFD